MISYWTVLPNTFTNRRLVVKAANINTMIINSIILVWFDSCYPIPELKTVSTNTIINNFRYTVIVQFNKNGQVQTVYRLLDMLHPNDVTVACINFKTSIGSSCCYASREDHLELAKILSGQILKINFRGYRIWEKALNRFICGFINYKDDIIWEIPDFTDDTSKFLTKFSKMLTQFD